MVTIFEKISGFFKFCSPCNGAGAVWGILPAIEKISGFVRFFNLLGYVGILHDTGKMLGFVKFYAAGGAEVCVCLSWNWLNLSIKSLFGGMDAPTASETPL